MDVKSRLGGGTLPWTVAYTRKVTTMDTTGMANVTCVGPMGVRSVRGRVVDVGRGARGAREARQARESRDGCTHGYGEGLQELEPHEGARFLVPRPDHLPHEGVLPRV
jgi:hypothetical protein